jgi:hypothetical protein
VWQQCRIDCRQPPPDKTGRLDERSDRTASGRLFHFSSRARLTGGAPATSLVLCARVSGVGGGEWVAKGRGLKAGGSSLKRNKYTRSFSALVLGRG